MIKGEDSRVEYKYFFPENDQKWLKTVIAFLNSGLGGQILFGISDTGEKKGIQFFDGKAEEKKNLKISKVHYCYYKNFAKCIDRILIYISNKINNHILPKVLATFYYIEIVQKNPFIISLTILPTSEFVYRLDEKLLSNSKQTGVFLRSGSQTVQLTTKEVEIFSKTRKKQTNIEYLSSSKKRLSFHKLHSFYGDKFPNYSKFLKYFQNNYDLFIPGTKKYNFEAFLLSDSNSIKLKINNFSSQLHPTLKPRQFILKSMCILEFVQFLLLFFRDLNNYKKLWEEKLIEGIVKNIVLHNDYYNFNNNGPTIEIFDDHLVFFSYQKGGINIILENQISAVRYPIIKKMADEIFGDNAYGIKQIIYESPTSIISDEISVEYTITFKTPQY